MKELYKRTPFKEPLIPIPSDENEHLYNFRNNKNYIVRDNHIILGEDGKPDIHDIDIADTLFNELERDYGISVVPYDTVIGYNPETEGISAYMIANKVVGSELPQAVPEEEEAKRFFSGLLNYHIDKYEQGGYYIADLNEDDFMYGTTNKNSTKKIYLVDLDQFYEYIDDLSLDKRLEYFTANLESLNNILNILEENSKSNFTELRKKFKEFLVRIKHTLHPDDRATINTILISIENKITEEMTSDLSENRFEKSQNEREVL